MDFTGKAETPRGLSDDGRVWFLLTADKPGHMRRSLAIEARDEAHARKRVRNLLLANDMTVAGCKPMTREAWICVDSSYPLPAKRADVETR